MLIKVLLLVVVLQNLLRFVAVTASAISHHHSTAATVSSTVSPRDAYTHRTTRTGTQPLSASDSQCRPPGKPNNIPVGKRPTVLYTVR